MEKKLSGDANRIRKVMGQLRTTSKSSHKLDSFFFSVMKKTTETKKVNCDVTDNDPHHFRVIKETECITINVLRMR